MIADSRSIAAFYIAIYQILSYRAMHVRDRSVIEITAEDCTHPPMLPDVSRHRFGLGRTFLRCLCQLHHQELGGLLGSIHLQFSYDQFLELLTVFQAQARCLQMIIDKQNWLIVDFKR